MNKPEKSLIINVCIIPNQQVCNSYINISQSLKSEDAMFVLGDGKFAHMTVFMARFAESEIQDVIESVGEITKSMKTFECHHVGYFLTEGRYLEASYDKSSSFINLHESLVSGLAKYRINPSRPFIEGYFAPYNIGQQKNAQETGYDLAHELYRPHITITRYKENRLIDKIPAMPEVELSFNLSKICIYKADDNGAVYELIKSFEI